MARKKKKGSRGLLSADQQREVLAVGLLALALFTLLALVPPDAFGARGPEWFPSGNPMGTVGATVESLLVAAFGAASVLVPLLLFLLGLLAGQWGSASWIPRISILAGAFLLLVPVALHVHAPDPAAGGWLGETLGSPLVSATGWLGATLLLVLALVLLSVLVLRWNPIRAAGQGMVRGGGLLSRGARSAAERMGVWWEDYRARSAERRAAARAKAAEGKATEASGSPGAGESAPEEPGSFAPEGWEEEGPVEEPEPEPFEVPEPKPRSSPRDDLLPEPDRGHDHDELPPVHLLDEPELEARRDMEEELDRLGQVLVEKLETFNVKCELGGRTTGPVVTQFEVVPAAGVKVNRIANLDADLALAMKAPSIRIVAPIPGKGAVGVEIPNPQPEIVHLREILDSKEYRRAKGQLPIALGKDLTGRPYVADLNKMPHLLIAGATGSGKSVCVNTIVTSLVAKHTPETLRLLMIDPKMVELSSYADLPHLRHAVVTDPSEAASVLKWAVFEMERRYQLLHANGVRSIAEFNKRVEDEVVLRWAPEHVGEDEGVGDPDRFIYDEGVLPYVVLVVDELADLMMQVQSEVETPLAKLAQKARAIGIHLIVATQRPSVNVITGLIKANFPTRIAFRVASKTDSRTILDQNGAEALLGNGDMLFLPPGQSEPVRVQGAYIATEETDRLISWYRAQEVHRKEEEEDEGIEPESEPDILAELRAQEMEDATAVIEETLEDWDELFRAAAEVCISHDQGSTSLLQRKLRVGYGRAARIVDQLHDAGILTAPDGTKPRDVLVTLDELDRIIEPD